jgi:hypothetical protein
LSWPELERKKSELQALQAQLRARRHLVLAAKKNHVFALQLLFSPLLISALAHRLSTLLSHKPASKSAKPTGKPRKPSVLLVKTGF